MLKPPQGIVDAGRVAHEIHQKIGLLIKPGLNLMDIELLAGGMISNAKMRPAFQGFNGYPAVTCLSVNSAVVHGIPFDYNLREGDIISVDLGVESDGWIVDTAITHPVGKVSPEIAQLLTVTEQSLCDAIKVAKAGNTVGDIGHAIQTAVEGAGFYIIHELTGHGVGRKLQMPPQIPNHGFPGKGEVLKEGMAIAIEPITALKPVKVTIAPDNWTIDATPVVACAHFEHTLFITKGEPIILTGKANTLTVNPEPCRTG